MAKIDKVYIEVWRRVTYGTGKEQYGFTVFDENGDELEEDVDAWTTMEAMLNEYPTPAHVEDYVKYESVYSQHVKKGAQIINRSLSFWGDK